MHNLVPLYPNRGKSIADLSEPGAPDFGRSVNPISIRGGEADYAHHITFSPPTGFSDLYTALHSIKAVEGLGAI